MNRTPTKHRLPEDLIKKARWALNKSGGNYTVTDVSPDSPESERSWRVGQESWTLKFTSLSAAREMVYQVLIGTSHNVLADIHGTVTVSKSRE